MKKIKLVITFCIVSLLLLNCKEQEKTVNQEVAQEFTFKQGVIASHWTDHLIFEMSYADSDWFNHEEVKWVANQGLDHIQIPLSGNLITDDNGEIIKDRLAPLDSAIVWSKKEKIGTIINLMNFPEFKIDSTLSEETQASLKLQKQVDFWGELSNHFSKQDSNLRFALYGRGNLTENIGYLNEFNTKALQEVRKSHTTRKVYLATFGIDKLNELLLPKNDKNIGLWCSYVGAEDVFVYQHSIYRFPENFPLISFPTTLPNFSTVLEKDHRAQQYSNVTINEDYFEKRFENATSYIKSIAPTIEIYIRSWGYYVDLPIDPEAVEDKESIHNFAKAFRNATTKQNIGWAIYDIRTGMAVKDSLGNATPILNGLDLKKK